MRFQGAQGVRPMGASAWSYRQHEGIGVLTLDVPDKSANTLGGAVLRELATQLDAVERAPPQGLILRSGKPAGFIAGADINEFTAFANMHDTLVAIRLGQALCDRAAALPCPTVALLHGF